MTDFKKLIDTEEYNFRFACGVTKATGRMEFSDKNRIIEALCLHSVVLVSLAELEQRRRGLTIQKFDSLMESCPNVLRKAPAQKITCEFIQDIFVPTFSAAGSNKRVIEEGIVMTWVRYLQHVEIDLHIAMHTG